MRIAVCVPTIRPDKFREEFLPAWQPLFEEHNVSLFVVHDGTRPQIFRHDFGQDTKVKECDVVDVYRILYTFSDVCRNAAFYAALKYMNPDIYISLDDDVLPDGDTIRDHVRKLQGEIELDWMNTARRYRMRGLPYQLKKYPVLLSHGVWKGVPDLDAIQQMNNPDLRNVSFPRGLVPRGVFFPVCAMNFAFRKEVLPYAYQAPMGQRLASEEMPALDRFGDIWAGVVMKHAIDTELQGAAVTGYASVHHDRASNVYANLRKEAPGMELNETFADEVKNGLQNSKHPYCQLYAKQLQAWKQLTRPLL